MQSHSASDYTEYILQMRYFYEKKDMIVWFDDVDQHDVGLVGGKGANLGEMTQAGFPYPIWICCHI